MASGKRNSYRHLALAALGMGLWAMVNIASAQASAAAPAAQSASGVPANVKWVAGLQPDRRPEGAPIQAERQIADKQLDRWLTGVSKPWPGNVEQIARTGAWFVPLRHPGMWGAYDIRGWHSASKAPA